VSDADLKLMRRIDELHLEFPFAGSRMLRDLLRGVHDYFHVLAHRVTSLIPSSLILSAPSLSLTEPDHIPSLK
jgi:uncharacterized protein with HEPN domain